MLSALLGSLRALWGILVKHRLAAAGVATLFTGVWLASFQESLSLDGAVGMDLFLAATEHAKIATRWDNHHLLSLAACALWADLVVFIPAYGSFFFLAARRLRRELALDVAAFDVVSLLYPHASGMALRISKWLALDRLLAGLVVLLVVADVIEDGFGLYVLHHLKDGDAASIMSTASAMKGVLVVAVLLAFVVLLSLWLFNLGHPHGLNQARARVVQRRLARRAMLRRDLADIVWRSRYCIAMIGFFAAAGIYLNQGADVLVGITQPAAGASTWTVLGAIAASIAAVWLFAHACYIWPRVLCRLQRPSGVLTPASPAASQRAAKWWARFLGATPMLMLTWLSGLAAHAAFAAVDQKGDPADFITAFRTGSGILWCGLASALLGLMFFGVRSVKGARSPRPHPGYFEVVSPVHARDEVINGDYHILLFIPRATVCMIPVALLAMLLIRLWGLTAGDAPLALAALAVALALWSTVIGHVSALALRQETPWVLFAVVVIGVLGLSGWTENHRVPTFSAEGSGLSLLDMSLASAALAVILLAWVGVALFTKPTLKGRRLLVGALAGVAAFGVAGVLNVASDADGPSASAAGKAPVAVPKSIPMDHAVLRWMRQMCALEAGCASGAKTGDEAGKVTSVDAYVVAAEGGGIRSAYWTSRVLTHLAMQREQFVDRTFSVSGVSGGAMGAAVWKACLGQPSPRTEGRLVVNGKALEVCTRRLGEADLLTPLVSAWLFEDFLGRFIPTTHCATAGCGFMSRGLWFERALEGSVAEPGSTSPLVSPLNGVVDAGSEGASRRLPYLFLNSTVVESGERAIASDVNIVPDFFPAARDQQRELDAKLKLSTAAHNAARFPFVNAIGVVQSEDCLYQKRERSGPKRKQPCLRLADGGYFDNSGTQTAQDIVRALGRQLDKPVEQIDPADRSMTSWLRPRLRITGIFLRNGVESDAERRQCGESFVSGASAPEAASPAQAPYNPSKPTCQGPLHLYADLLGPLVTAKNAGGTGASGRLAESRLQSVIDDFNRRDDRRDTAKADAPSLPVVAIELRKGHVLYPLGWYLSRQARDAIDSEAQTEAAKAPLPQAGKHNTAVALRKP